MRQALFFLRGHSACADSHYRDVCLKSSGEGAQKARSVRCGVSLLTPENAFMYKQAFQSGDLPSWLGVACRRGSQIHCNRNRDDFFVLQATLANYRHPQGQIPENSKRSATSKVHVGTRSMVCVPSSAHSGEVLHGSCLGLEVSVSTSATV